jgi:leucyl-tRNA synthetase
MTEKYDPKAFESHWQQKWEDDQLYRATVDWNRPKHYALTMLPYPSGDLHIGHWFAMTPSDARARWMRMKGYNVLFPMGFDAFGLPAENAAVQRNIHPAEWTRANIERMRSQMRQHGRDVRLGARGRKLRAGILQMDRMVLQAVLRKRPGLSRRGNGELVADAANRAGQRAGHRRQRRTHRPAGHPEDDDAVVLPLSPLCRRNAELQHIDWPEPIKIMQTNWIGRSEGANVTFHTEQGDPIRIYTTRPDTLWGATFMVLAPEHPLVEKITTAAQRAAIEAYVAQAAAPPRSNARRKTARKPACSPGPMPSTRSTRNAFPSGSPTTS